MLGPLSVDQGRRRVIARTACHFGGRIAPIAAGDHESTKASDLPAEVRSGLGAARHEETRLT